jgi:Phosphotransferase enzyme family
MNRIADNAIRLPVKIEDVTAHWLTEALAATYPGVEVTSARIGNILWGTATKVPVQVEFNSVGQQAQLPASLIVKGGFSEHRHVLERCYDLEVRFYRDVLPLLGINAPKAFFAAHDPANHQHIVVLEDLNLRDVSFCRVQQPLSYAQAAAHLDVLARMHARWWDSPVLEEGGELGYLRVWDPLPPGEEGAYQWGQLQPQVWSHYMGLPRACAVPKLMHDREQMQRALLQLQAFDRLEPYCFLHGDYHLGNLYFDADGQPGTLDWQSFTKGPWSHDVTYFLVSALDIADRRKWDKALLSYYLERLAAHGVCSPPSLETAWDAFRRQIIDGLYFWLVNPVEMQAEVNNAAVAPRFAMAALDCETFELMEDLRNG